MDPATLRVTWRLVLVTVIVTMDVVPSTFWVKWIIMMMMLWWWTTFFYTASLYYYLLLLLSFFFYLDFTSEHTEKLERHNPEKSATGDREHAVESFLPWSISALHTQTTSILFFVYTVNNFASAKKNEVLSALSSQSVLPSFPWLVDW